MSATLRRLIIPAVLIEALLVGIRVLPNLGTHVVEAIGLLLLTASLYLISVYNVTYLQANAQVIPRAEDRRTASTNGGSHAALWLIVIAGLVFRVTVWPVFPALSDDAYRYRWEGKLQAAGGNPYEVRPIDDRWASLRDATWPNVGSKDFKTVYGPATELLEHATYLAFATLRDPFAQVFWFKLPSALADLGILYSVYLLLAARGLPPERLLIYAWSPVPLAEFWMTGHNDAWAILFITLATVAAAREKWQWAYTSLAMAIAFKIWPAILLPAFLWRSRSRLQWLWAAVIPCIFLLFAWPLWTRVTENAQFASGFVGGWRNNDSAFGLLLLLSGGDLYRAKYTAFALIAIFAVFAAIRPWPLEKAALATIAVLLAVSANCHPWYMTWFFPFITIWPFLPILLWASLMPLSYGVLLRWHLLGEWVGSTSARWYVYGPVYGMLLLTGALAVWNRYTQARRQSL